MKGFSKNKFDAKGLAVIAVMSAMLVGGQFILSFASGVEIVSLLLCAFCIVFGVSYGLITALAFCLLRCFVFGFVPNVVVLYFIYYPLFALVLGGYGMVYNKYVKTQENGLFHTKKAVVFVGLVLICAFLTACFTLIDDIVAPLIMGLKKPSALAYFYNSLPTMFTHVVMVSGSVALLFTPIYRVMSAVKYKAWGEKCL